MVAPLLAVVGLQREAASVASPGVVTAAGGGDTSGLREKLERLAASQAFRAIVSVGLGGALSPSLEVGDAVVAERVVSRRRSWATDAALARQLEAALRPLTLCAPHRDASSPLPLREREGPVAQQWEGEESRRGFRVFTGAIAASDVMVADAAAKAALHAATGALAVDMESHVAAAFAAEHGLPFAALRVISDGADRALPRAAQAGMKRNGGMDVLAVLRALVRDPRQLPALIRTGLEAEVAFRQLALLNRHDLLGRLGVGDADFGQLLLDVV